MVSLNALKALAIILVTHSHMDAFYPMSAVATGGMLGNTLFFFVSGYGLALSLAREKVAFWPWYLKRLWRIYAPLWLALVIFIPLVFRPQTPFDALRLLLIPQEYWFLPTIAILYAPAYLVINRFQAQGVQWLLIAILLAYIAALPVLADPARWSAEDSVPLKAMFYFGALVGGVYLQKLGSRQAQPGFLITAALTVGYFAFLTMLRVTDLYILQAGANLIALSWTFAIFRYLSSEGIERVLRRRAERGITLLSSITIQIYLVQVPLISYGRLEELHFPLDVALLWSTVVLLAWGFARATHLFLTWTERRLLMLGRPD